MSKASDMARRDASKVATFPAKNVEIVSAENALPKSPSSGGIVNSGDKFKLLLLVMMVLQNSSAVLVGRHTRASVKKEDLYSVNHLVFIVEFSKLLLATALEFKATNGMLYDSLKLHVLDRPKDSLKMCVPALLYLLQNTLLYVALGNLSAPVFQVTYQCKLVTTAVVSVLLLKRQYKFHQWICLFGISIGVAIVVLGEKGKNTDNDGSSQTQSLALGLIAVSVSCMCSAFAGVYFELVVKKKGPSVDSSGNEIAQPSLWMRNIQLAFYSMVIAYSRGIWEASTNVDNDGISNSYFHGFTTWVWVLVMVQAFGGLLVAAVIKYADNVLKGLATGVSVVFATTISILFMGTAVSGEFLFGAIIILGSVYVFSNPVDVSRIFRKNSAGGSLLPS